MDIIPVIQLLLLVSKLPQSYFHYDIIHTYLTPNPHDFPHPVHLYSILRALPSTFFLNILSFCHVLLANCQFQIRAVIAFPVTREQYVCRYQISMCMYICTYTQLISSQIYSIKLQLFQCKFFVFLKYTLQPFAI